MISIFTVLLAAIPLSGVLGGQVPVANNVLGGVPENAGSPKPQPASVSATTPGKLRVTENSGVCETTANVYQASGYGDLTSTESVWCVNELNMYI